MDTTRSLSYQIFGFLIVSVLLGATAQVVLPNGISAITDITMIESDSGTVAIPSVSINPQRNELPAVSISLKDALSAYGTQQALFLDARTPGDYTQGHILGAVNLPVEDFMDSLDYLDTLPKGQMIITYCDGEDCNASIDLAADLSLMGFTRVFFFFGGWQQWSAAGYPVAGILHE